MTTRRPTPLGTAYPKTLPPRKSKPLRISAKVFMIEWRVYYENGDVYDNEQGSWEDAPVDGVQCVAVRHPIYGRQVYHGADYYLDPPFGDHISQTNDLGPTLRKGVRWIKFGRSVPREQYEKVLKQACDDPAFPKTSPRRRASDRGS